MKKTVKANMQHATQQGESSTTSPKRLLWAVNEDSASQKHQQVRRDFTGQSMETPPVTSVNKSKETSLGSQ
jgi:hypothetical protein